MFSDSFFRGVKSNTVVDVCLSVCWFALIYFCIRQSSVDERKTEKMWRKKKNCKLNENEKSNRQIHTRTQFTTFYAVSYFEIQLLFTFLCVFVSFLICLLFPFFLFALTLFFHFHFAVLPCSFFFCLSLQLWINAANVVFFFATRFVSFTFNCELQTENTFIHTHTHTLRFT